MAFIGIDRAIRDHWIYKDPEYFKVWFEIICCARFAKEPKTDMQDGEIYTLNYGEFMFGRISWSERLNVGEQRIRTLLKKLIKENMIELVSKHRRFSIYKVVNYEKYNHQANHQETYTGQGFSEDGNQQINHPLTSSQPAANQQLTTKEQCINKVNKVNKEKNKTYTPEFDEFWNAYPRKLGKAESFKVWERVLKKGENADFVIMCARNYATDCQNRNTEDQYIKHPKTFLNEERYKDYSMIVVGGGNGGKYGESHGGSVEASRKAASRGAEHFIGTPGSERGGLSTEEVRQLASNFE